jgi:hypothetical protein
MSSGVRLIESQSIENALVTQRLINVITFGLSRLVWWLPFYYGAAAAAAVSLTNCYNEFPSTDG